MVPILLSSSFPSLSFISDHHTHMILFFFLSFISEIQEWLKSEKIDHHFEALKKHKFDGKALVELKALLLPPNPSFLSYVSDLLKITELGETLRLFAAIRRL